MGTQAYLAVTDTSYKQILKKTSKKWNQKYKYQRVNVLPYSYPIPKMNKWPNLRWRFLAGISNEHKENKNPKQKESDVPSIYKRLPHQPTCSTTPASIYLSNQLQVVMRLLQMKDNEQYIKTGIRRCWFTRSIDDVFTEIKHVQDYLKHKNPRTFDFTNMYTGLDHNKIKANVREAIKEARTYANDCNAKDGRRRYDLASELAKDTKLFDHLDFVVDNTYIRTQGGIFKHQVIGLPMGTNSAQELADLTTYINE